MEAPRWPRSNIPPPTGGVGIDYVFSEVELEEILTFMQDNNAGPSLPAASMALQFLPSDGLGEPSYDDDLGLEGDAFQAPAHVQPFELGVPLEPELNPSSRQHSAEPRIKSEPQAVSNVQGRHDLADMPGVASGNEASALELSGGVTLARGTRIPGQAVDADTSPLSTAFAQLGAGGLSSPTPRPLPRSADPAPAPATAHKRGSKQHTSHSTVEKNRRDRINSLIDELRDLVPPQSKDSVTNSQEMQDPTKRPKHVVLSDTIMLVKSLQHKVSDVEKALRRAQSGAREDSIENGAQDLLRRSLPEGTTFSSDSTSSSGPSNELPPVPTGAQQSSGVVVEQSDGCLYVKVNCRDRRGLLSDVIMALKSYPLEITTAAVTTTADGFVYDVFQVKAPLGQEVSQEDIQCHVHYALYPSSSREPQLGDKRQRIASD